MATWNLIRHPVDTVSGIPSSAWEAIRRTSELARSERGALEESAFREFIGFESRKRELAYRLGVDPYSSNKVLQTHLNRFAWVSYAGEFPFLLVPFQGDSDAHEAPVDPPGTSETRLGELLRDYSPEDLRRLNRIELAVIGIPEPLAHDFLQHPWFSPRHETVFVESSDGRGGAEQCRVRRGGAHARARSSTPSSTSAPSSSCAPTTSTAPRSSAASRSAAPSPVASCSAGVTDDGTLVVPELVDYLVWTRPTEALAQELAEGLPSDLGVRRRELLLSGTLSGKARAEFESRGIGVTTERLPQPGRRAGPPPCGPRSLKGWRDSARRRGSSPRATEATPGRGCRPDRVRGSPAVSVTGCGGARPATKGPEAESSKEPTILSTVHADEAVGEEVSEEVAVEIGIVHDRELDAYLKAIGRRLTRHAPGYRFTYSFAVIDQDTPNAFALPGGYIFVSRGLLVLANSEDELANVLAHEIIHVARRHAAARQLSLRDVPAVLPVAPGEGHRFLQPAPGGGGGPPRPGPRGPGGLRPRRHGDVPPLPRLHGASPLRLAAHSELPGHPPRHLGAQRRSRRACSAHCVAAPRRESEPGRGRYLDGIEGMVVGSSAAEGVFQGSRFIHPDLGFTLRFPEGWETRNTRRAVGATSPARDAQVFLEHAGEGNDPEKTAKLDLEEFVAQGLRVESDGEGQARRCRPAVRVDRPLTMRFGGSHVVFTWIAQRGSVYRLTGVSSGCGVGRRGALT